MILLKGGMGNRSKAPTEESIRAWARLLRVSRALLGAVESDLKAEGFPPLSWYDALLELRRAGAGGLRPFELQNEMLLAQYNISRLLDRLAQAGYVERLACRDDGRGKVFKLTPKGEALLKDMWPAYRHAIHEQFSKKIGRQDVQALGRILQRLT